MSAEDRAASVWIVHREQRARVALARLAGVGQHALLGEPGDALFDSAAAPSVVVLGLGGDFERELEFVHRMLPRLRESTWILCAASGAIREAARLFEGVASDLFAYPPDPRELRAAIARCGQKRRAQPLSKRRSRDLLTARFAHWFGDLEIPGLMRALDPGLATLPLLVRGEIGTGRGLLARYVHSFGSDGSRRFVHLACQGAGHEADVLEQLEGAASGTSAAGSTIWLDEVDLLPSWLQRHVKDWVEFGLPESAASLEPVRWMASAGEDLGLGPERLDHELAELLSAHCLRAPSLRVRPDAIARFAREAAHNWTRTGGLATRHFSDDALAALQQHPWPGNLRELEAAIVRTLSSSREDPLTAEHLRFQAEGEEFDWLDREAEPSTDAAAGPIASAPATDDDEDPFAELATAELAPSEARAAAAFAEVPAARTSPERVRKPVDIAAILDSTLDDLRERIQSRRLLVLKELDRDAPMVLGDSEELRAALGALLERALASVPDRGDIYLASSHHPTRLAGQPSVRVLLRYRRPDPDAQPGVLGAAPHPAATDEASSDELALAERVVREHGGALTVDAADRRERVIVIDLPAGPDA